MNTAEIIKKVKEIEIKTGRLVSETFAGEYQSVFKGRGIEFEEVREYVYGDDIRDIDWNVTARFSKAFIKKYSEERELTVMILCDISASQTFGSTDKLKNEISAELAAMFAFSALKKGDKTGLLLFSDDTELYIPPRKGKNHVLRIIRDMLAYSPKSLKTNIAKALDNVNKLLKRSSIVFLISDFIDDNFEKSLKLARIKHDIIPIMVSDKLERELPKMNILFETEDIETGKRLSIDLSNESFLKEYKKINREKKEKTEKLFKNLGINWISIDSRGEPYKEVVKFFKRREKAKWR